MKCTSDNSEKVFSILVSYFDIDIGESVVQHYESGSLIEVIVKSLFKCICNCFIIDDIPFQNLVSDLSDSTNYMRGKEDGLKNDFDAKLHNFWILTATFAIMCYTYYTVKQLCKPLNALLKNGLATFIGTQSYSTDISHLLKEICFILNIPF